MTDPNAVMKNAREDLSQEVKEKAALTDPNAVMKNVKEDLSQEVKEKAEMTDLNAVMKNVRETLSHAAPEKIKQVVLKIRLIVKEIALHALAMTGHLLKIKGLKRDLLLMRIVMK